MSHWPSGSCPRSGSDRPESTFRRKVRRDQARGGLLAEGLRTAGARTWPTSTATFLANTREERAVGLWTTDVDDRAACGAGAVDTLFRLSCRTTRVAPAVLVLDTGRRRTSLRRIERTGRRRTGRRRRDQQSLHVVPRHGGRTGRRRGRARRGQDRRRGARGRGRYGRACRRTTSHHHQCRHHRCTR